MNARLSQILYLAFAQLRQRHVRTSLGFIWLFVQPALTFTVFYVVSVYGLKMGARGGSVPFFAVLFCGLMPWMTVAESIGGASSAFATSKNLLYDRAATPIVLVASSTLAAAMMHIMLFAIVAFVLWLGGIPLQLSWFAAAYYYACLVSLLFAVSMVIAPLTARSADAAQAVNSLLLIWFWGSPVIWSAQIVPDSIVPYLRLNPIFYILEGYRGALLYGDWFPAPLVYHFVFWATVAAIAALGYTLLRLSETKLREWLQK